MRPRSGVRSQLLEALGGEAGCKQLATAFYARVGKDPILRPLFPGKSQRCAIEEFGSFLIQFLGGDEEQTQHRWWLSLSESHARFEISPAQRSAWLGHMAATLDAAPLEADTRQALSQFFIEGAAYVTGNEHSAPAHEELATRWREQRALDATIAAIAAGRDDEALAIAPRFADRPSVFVGLLTRMLRSGSPELSRFVVEALESDPSLTTHRFAGNTILHSASAAGCSEAVLLCLRLGMNPNLPGRGSHTPLYSVANECTMATGPEIVHALIHAGADVNAGGGITRTTPLHMAARRGFVDIAVALLERGAAIDAIDNKGHTPLRRAINCRKQIIARLLIALGAANPKNFSPRSNRSPR